MSPVRVNFQTNGVEQVNKSLQRFQLDSRNVTPLWDSLSASFAYYMRRQFSSQGAELGTPWPDIQSRRYKALKDRYYPGQPVLVQKGILRDSLTRRPFGVDRTTKLSATFGTDIPYAKKHQDGIPEGTPIPIEIAGHRLTIYGLPKRPIVLMNSSMQNSWTKKIQRWLVTDQTTSSEEA